MPGLHMDEFTLQYVQLFLSGYEYINLTSTCKLLLEYQTNDYLRRLWKHGKVRNLKTAFYIEHKLLKYRPETIIQEAPSEEILKSTYSAFRCLLSRRMKTKFRKFRRDFLPVNGKSLVETIGPIRLKLGKRTRNCI